MKYILNNGQYNLNDLNTTSFIVIKFTGCTPNTNIGTLYINVAASI